MVYGPAGSGKTGRLVDHAARRYQDDRFASTLVLVPTARHGDQFRRRLVAACGVALDLDVSTLAQYARLHAAGRTLSREVAADLLRRVALERIASGGAGRFEPIAEKPGLHALIAEAVAELVAADVEPTTFAEAASESGSADLGALGDIYDAYRRALADRGWRDPGEAPSLAAEAIEGGARATGSRARRLVRVPQPARAVARRGPDGPHPRAGRHRSRGERAGRAGRHRASKRSPAPRPSRSWRRVAALPPSAPTARSTQKRSCAGSRGRSNSVWARRTSCGPRTWPWPSARRRSTSRSPAASSRIRAAVRPGRRRAACLAAVRDLGAGAAAAASARLAADAAGPSCCAPPSSIAAAGVSRGTPPSTCCASGDAGS